MNGSDGRDEQVAEWIRITEKLSSQSGTKGLGHRPEGGVNAAARELDVPAVLRMCSAAAPANLPVETAIAAHLKSLDPWRDQPQSWNALRAVILAATPTIEDSRRQLAYLERLPDAAWPVGVGEYESRMAVMASIRRSIAWRQFG